MKFGTDTFTGSRPYRQAARAEATAATRRRIIEAFLGFARDQWLDEITLDEVAKAAGVTMQTVIRHYGGKDGLISAADALFSQQIPERRAVPPGAVDQALSALVADYELTGDVVIRFLAQEDRYPALHRALAYGRANHRSWVENILAPALASLQNSIRERRLNALIAATDVYTWKLLRRDLGHAQPAVVAVMRDLVRGLIDDPPTPAHN